MKILELFCGTKSLSKVAEELGHECFTVDILQKFNPDLCKNVLDLSVSDIPFIPDVIWASPPCTEYSHAKSRGVRKIDEANEVVLKTLEIIREFNPKIWVLENPQSGRLKNQLFMQNLPYSDASYCKYGYTYRKQTRFWNNIQLRLKTCNRDCGNITDKKHLGSAGNNRSMYTDKVYSLQEKYSIPRDLCIKIVKSFELELLY